MNRLTSRQALRWWILLGAIGGACIPFVTRQASGAPLTGRDLWAGDAALTVSVSAGYGALAAWAIAALIGHFRRTRA